MKALTVALIAGTVGYIYLTKKLSFGTVIDEACGASTPSFAYDKNHVKDLEGLDDVTDQYGNPVTLTQQGSIKEIAAVFSGFDPPECGDFSRVALKLATEKVVKFEHLDGGWINIEDELYYLPSVSKTVRKYPCGMVLDIGDSTKILALFGYFRSSDDARLLTLVYINQDTAKIVFNKEFNAKEIVNTEGGYKIVGSLYCGCWCRKPHEILITPNELKLQELPFEEVYKDSQLPVTLYNAPGWGQNKKPGEFTRITIPHYEKQKEIFKLDHCGVCTQVPDDIYIPADVPEIEKMPYYIKVCNQLLIFFARPYNGNDKRITTVISLAGRGNANDIAAPKLDRKFHLTSITKIPHGYQCLGKDLESRDNCPTPIKGFNIIIDEETESTYLRYIEKNASE